MTDLQKRNSRTMCEMFLRYYPEAPKEIINYMLNTPIDEAVYDRWHKLEGYEGEPIQPYWKILKPAN